MKVVLLAAGLGSRLRPITNNIPKCLVPINGKPLLNYWLEMFAENAEIDEIIINCFYLKNLVFKFINDNWLHCKKITLINEEQLLGTAGTLVNLSPRIQGQKTLVVHANNLSFFDLNTFIIAHKNRPAYCDMTMMLFRTDSPSSCGIVELNHESVVDNMHEKVINPPSDLANAAIYILEPQVTKWLVTSSAIDISNDVIPHFFGRIFTWENRTYHRDIGTPESLELANLELKNI
ncbi:MAG: nucleotidyltransferase family protein [Aestuariibacter sp.]